VEKQVKQTRPYTVCAIVKNLSLDDNKIKSIIDLQEKLHITLGRNRKKIAIGIYPLDKITLPIRYTAKKPSEIKFTPLESDRELTGHQILKNTPTGRKYSYLLKNEKFFPIFIDAKSNVLSMPPIINSKETGRITEETKSVFVECSGSDLELLNKTLNIIVTTLADMDAEIYQMEIQDDKKTITPDLAPEKIKVSLENINKLLGLSLSQKQLSSLLTKMGHEYKPPYVLTPPWRVDILHEVDIAEDVAIAYGYDNFIPEIPIISTTAEETKESKIKSKIAELLIGLGFNEISTYHTIKPEEAKLMKLDRPIELLDSKTEYKILRPNLFIPALRILSENIDTEYPQKIFEIGTIFKIDEKTETGIAENEHLILALTPGNFTEAKQHLDYLFSSFNLQYRLQESKNKGFIEGRTGNILIDKTIIGHLGEISPFTLNRWGLKMPLAILEIDLKKIYNFLL